MTPRLLALPSPGDMPLILAALDEAAAARRERARAGGCERCAVAPGRWCDGCAGDLAAAEAYDGLYGRLLGGDRAAKAA